MRQRAMIAMAMITEPKLLIADEPTTALDVTIQAQILELILEIAEEQGTSVLFISHDLGVVASISDQMMVMYGGQVHESGSADQVFND
ncbi:MAG TPA: glutathione ABC transporter ATP-binding protein GsiA, partial [Candidatus Latescibacteria bacterium]|nr:glutathione ABC transporter ATP-binding protein GsiA [Candidatus Latescibacterota bacterium]